MRQDLLTLTPDDLVLLANRGLVKRAQQEIQAGELAATIGEDAEGTVTFQWSDGVECVFPAGVPANAARCNCPATSICRHLLRSVLAYQLHSADAGDTAAAQTPTGPWDPGAFSDEQLAALVSRTARSWATQMFAAGQVIELVRSAKPSAYFHTLACSVRFLVPNDLNYTHCDCKDPAPCRHVPLAVMAFRALKADATGGIIESAPHNQPAPAGLLDELDQTLRELASVGMNGATQSLIEQIQRLEKQARKNGLIWPADALADLLQQHTAYTAHDARFEPARIALLFGELCVRSDAIRAQTGAVPQLFIRGTNADQDTLLSATARFIGLGCDARLGREQVVLAAYMQDVDSGALVAVRREISDPANAAPVPIEQQAQVTIAKGATLAGLGAGQALIKGGRRRPNGELVPGRSQLVLNPQAYAWESLRAPVLAESFDELSARIAAQPPAALRPRRLTDGLYVCATAGIEQSLFDPREQAVKAVLVDHTGGRALLNHPFTTRGQTGVNALLRAMQQRAGDLRFVAGHVRLGPRGVQIAPTMLVFQDGATRIGVQPWVARDQAGEGQHAETFTPGEPSAHDPLAEYWAQIDDALADLLVVGLQRSDERMARRWQELARLGGAFGFGRSLAPVEKLATALEARAHIVRWDATSAAVAVLEIACLTVIAAEALSVV